MDSVETRFAIPAGQAVSTTRERLAIAALALAGLAGWMLQHPYYGVLHDAMLYTLLAVQHLHPGDLSNDVFVRFGSQDSFTIFSPLYAATIAVLGLDRAAAVLTFLSTLAVFGGCWLIARRLMPARVATLALALVAILPSGYGAGIYFHYAEQFVTPRLPAEALVLGAIAASMARRYWIAILCMCIAIVLHPVMAAAGGAMLVLTFYAPQRPKLVIYAGLILLAGSLLLLEISAPHGRFDTDWLQVVRSTSPSLYLDSWSLSDWNRLAVPVTVLALGAFISRPSAPRELCRGALLTVFCGLLISAIYCDLFHVILFTDLQSWRWTWLGTLLAFLLLPTVATQCWSRGTLGHAAVVLLACGWLFYAESFGAAFLAASLACALAPRAISEQSYARLVLFAALLALVIGVATHVSDDLAYPGEWNPQEPLFVQHARWICMDGVVPLLVVGALWLALRYAPSILGLTWALLGLALASCCIFLQPTWQSWSGTYFARLLAPFAAWRAAIPPQTEVMWSDNPVGVWYLLQRPSYWSAAQQAGAIFSRDKAMLMRQRADDVNQALLRGGLLKKDQMYDAAGNPIAYGIVAGRMQLDALKMVCADRHLGYFVGWQPIAPTPFAPIVVDPTKANGKLYLYRCADLRTD